MTASTIHERDRFTDAVLSTDTLHYYTHEGAAFSATVYTASLGNGATLILRISTGSKYAHMHATASGGGACIVEMLEEAEFSAPGAAVSSYNRNRNSPTLSVHNLYKDPTISSDGTNFGTILLPGSSKGAVGGGGEGGGRNEWILKPSTEYAIRLTNTEGVAADYSIDALWYELG
jgi:hypothetical protein